ncbi:uncharacterized protein K02A2.6-like [Phymastichus coffea]|uniref:uncharacterized protein K02A2.6-like n=1 Tax=Phymastichus coffea TaxID=108790 RepID=UPI00273A83E8|nr:uncharacterized protein K02A2.6-like [Phymastichus coffea]
MAYDKNILLPVGKLLNLEVKINNKICLLECFVLAGDGPALIGRQWLAAFDYWPLQLRNGKNNIYNLNIENVAKDLSKKYTKLFSNTPGEYNRSKTKLVLEKNVKPIAMKYRHVAHALSPLIEEELERLMKLGYLVPVEVSEWATPIVPIFKDNGKIRICGDFKVTINKHLLSDKYGLHIIDDIFFKLQGGSKFNELDLKHAYMQFPVDEESSKLLTIVTNKGMFRYNKLTEGVATAPPDCQRKMDECLSSLDGVIAYIDNIYVTGKTDEEHRRNLDLVCKRLQDCNLRLNLSKCFFMKDKLEVLGFVVNKNGLHKAKSKVQAMVDAPQPRNQKELESFLGLINFYARFLENRSHRLRPLYELSHKNKFVWNAECDRAFTWVKEELISPRVLVNYDPKEKVY